MKSENTTTLKTWAVAAAVAGLVAGCGGGGGSSGTPLTPATPVTISSANADKVAAEGSDAASTNLAAGLSSLSGVEVQSSQQVAAPGMAQILLNSLQLVAANQPAQALQGVQTPYAFNCATSGSVTITVTTAGASLQAGDSLSLAFSNCLANGILTNGTLGFQITSFSGQLLVGGAYTLAGHATFQSVSALVSGTGAQLSGAIDVSIAQTSANNASVSISGVSATANRFIAGSSVATRTLSNFSETVATTSTSITSSFDGTVSGTFPRLGSNVSFTIATQTSFVRDVGALYPKSGQVKITGANNSSLTLTAVDATNATLALDANGDGTVDTGGTVTTTWSALASLLL